MKQVTALQIQTDFNVKFVPTVRIVDFTAGSGAK